MRPLRIIVFPGGFNWPLWVAQEQGFFLRNGIALDLATTPGSAFQWAALAEGEADLAITLMDNVVAYCEGQGEAPVVVPDAVALMGLDTAVLPALVTARDVRAYSDLKGRSLSVDALSTGYAFVLIAMLEHRGLKEGNYRLERVGGVTQRFEAMKRNEHAGALFNSPFEQLLKDLGFNILDTASSILPSYQGHVLTARSGWANKNRQTVVDLISTLLEAINWLYNPDNQQEAFAIFYKNTPDAASDAAATAHAVLFHPATGFPRTGELNIQGVRQLLALRSRYGRPRRTLRPPLAYCDRTFLDEAAKIRT